MRGLGMKDRFAAAMARLPLIAILRGIKPGAARARAAAPGARGPPSAEMITPAIVKAWRAVIPASAPIMPVGGIAPDNMGPYLSAGATGFGLGSALYRPGDSAAQVGAKAAAFVAAWRKVKG